MLRAQLHPPVESLLLLFYYAVACRYAHVSVNNSNCVVVIAVVVIDVVIAVVIVVVDTVVAVFV